MARGKMLATSKAAPPPSTRHGLSFPRHHGLAQPTTGASTTTCLRRAASASCLNPASVGDTRVAQPVPSGCGLQAGGELLTLSVIAACGGRDAGGCRQPELGTSHGSRREEGRSGAERSSLVSRGRHAWRGNQSWESLIYSGSRRVRGKEGRSGAERRSLVSRGRHAWRDKQSWEPLIYSGSRRVRGRKEEAEQSGAASFQGDGTLGASATSAHALQPALSARRLRG
jgi:hypothetical protein